MREHHPARVPWWQEVAIAGASHLSDSELLTLLLGVRRSHPSTSVAEALLHHPDGLIGLAGAVREGSRPNVPLRPRQRALLDSAFELVARIGRSQRAQRPELRTAAQVYAVVGAEMALLPHEELWCLPLDAHSRLIGRHHVVSVGDVDGCDAGPRNFFRHALLAGTRRHADGAPALRAPAQLRRRHQRHQPRQMHVERHIGVSELRRWSATGAAPLCSFSYHSASPRTTNVPRCGQETIMSFHHFTFIHDDAGGTPKGNQ